MTFSGKSPSSIRVSDCWSEHGHWHGRYTDILYDLVEWKSHAFVVNIGREASVEPIDDAWNL